MDSLYSPEGSTSAAEPEETEETESIDEEEASSPTAVIDNKVLSPAGKPLKEGDKITITVVKNFGDESEIKITTESAGSEVQPPDMMSESNSELDKMDEGY